MSIWRSQWVVDGVCDDVFCWSTGRLCRTINLFGKENQSDITLRCVQFTDHCWSLEMSAWDRRFLESLRCPLDFDLAFHADEKQVHYLVNKLETHGEELFRAWPVKFEVTYGLHVVIEMKFSHGLSVGTNLAVRVDNGEMFCIHPNRISQQSLEQERRLTSLTNQYDIRILFMLDNMRHIGQQRS